MAPNPAGPPPKTEAVAQVGSCAGRPGGAKGVVPLMAPLLASALPSIKSATGTFSYAVENSQSPPPSSHWPAVRDAELLRVALCDLHTGHLARPPSFLVADSENRCR